MTAVVVIPHAVSAFDATLGDVIQTVEDVNAVRARPSLRPDRLVLRSRLSSGVGRSNFKIGRPIGFPSAGCPTGHFRNLNTRSRLLVSDRWTVPV